MNTRHFATNPPQAVAGSISLTSKEMTPNPPLRHQNQQGRVSSAVRRVSLAKKTEKLLRLFEDQLCVSYAEKTVKNTLRNARRFLVWLDERGIALISTRTADIDAYQMHVCGSRQKDGTPYSIPTQHYRIASVKALFRFLCRRGYVLSDPSGPVGYPRPEKRLPRGVLGRDEARKLMEAPDVSTPLGLRDRAILEVFYSSALRRAELIELLVTDIDFARGTIFVRSGKGAKDRYVPIGERALFWLRLYLELVRPRFLTTDDDARLFLTSRGTSLCPDWLSRRIRRYLQQAGIPKKGSCHLLRHTVATLMLGGGADIRYVAEMLGHARLETTQRYTRVSIDQLRRVHASSHPAAGLDVAMATELCAVLPQTGPALTLT